MSDNKHRMWRLRAVSALFVSSLAATAIVAACDSNDDPEDAYAAAYYYPADVATSDMYWADDWVTDPFAFRVRPQLSGEGGAPGVVGGGAEAGEGGTAGRPFHIAVLEPGAAIRALARGQNVCPGQVTVSETKTRVACASTAGPGMLRTGAEIEFSNCTLEGGGKLSGSLVVSSTHTASDDDCDSNTVIDVSYTSAITNLSFTAASGRRVDIPTWSDTGSYSRTISGPPRDLSVDSNGSLKRFDEDGNLIANIAVNGTRTYAFGSDDQGSFYQVSGSVAAADTLRGSATVVGDGVTRRASCCRPVAGTLTITSSNRGTATIGYGPNCGELTVNGHSASTPECL